MKRISRKKLNELSALVGLPPLPNPPKRGKPDPIVRKLLGYQLITLVRQWEQSKVTSEELANQAITLVRKALKAEFYKTKGDFYAELNRQKES
jgi:hypothetical protein